METGLTSFAIFLGILWFLVYWILGGVFFAIIAILKLGRVRKVRFSCLFSLLALVVGFSASWFGISYASDSIESCTLQAVTRAESIISIFGCLNQFIINKIFYTNKSIFPYSTQLCSLNKFNIYKNLSILRCYML